MPPGKTTISAYNNLKQANLQILDKFGVKKKNKQTYVVVYPHGTSICILLDLEFGNFFYLYIEIQNEDQKSWLNPYYRN